MLRVRFTFFSYMKGFLGRDVWWLVFHVRREQRWNSGLQLKQESHKFNSRRNSAAAVNWEQQTHWIFTCLEAGPGWEALLKPYGTGWMIKRKHNYMGECGNDFSQLKKKKRRIWYHCMQDDQMREQQVPKGQMGWWLKGLASDMLHRRMTKVWTN